MAQIELKAFYVMCLGEDDCAPNTVASHFSDFDRAHELKDRSATIRRVLAGEGMINVMQPWVMPAAGTTSSEGHQFPQTAKLGLKDRCRSN